MGSSRPLGADLGRLWGLLLMRGLLMVAFGVLAVGFTRTAVEALIIMLGLFLIFDGVVTVITTAIERRKLQRSGWFTGQGVFAIVVGVVALLLPGLVTWTVLSLFVFWGAVIVGLSAGIAMFRFALSIKRAGGGFGVLGIVGAVIAGLAAALAIATALNPSAVALGLLWLIGIGSILLGIGVVVWAFGLRRVSREARETITLLPPER